MSHSGFKGLPWLELAFMQMLSITLFTVTIGVIQIFTGETLQLREMLILGVASSISSLVFTLIVFWAYRRKYLRSNPNFLVG